MATDVGISGANCFCARRVLAVAGGGPSFGVRLRTSHVGMDGHDSQLHVSISHLNSLSCARSAFSGFCLSPDDTAPSLPRCARRIRGLLLLQVDQQQMDVVRVAFKLVLVLLRHQNADKLRGDRLHHHRAIDIPVEISLQSPRA